MTLNNTLFLYTVVSFFYIISPGPAIFLAINNGMRHNIAAVILSSLGNILGLLFLSTISIIGLGSIILASATLFLWVKILGAGYLLYLGVKQFRAAKTVPKQDTDTAKQRYYYSYLFEGFFLAATNPKPILFFIAIFPQFLNASLPLAPQFLVMTAIFMVMSFLSLFGYGYLAKSAKRFFTNPISMQWFHRITGGIFIALGAGLLQLRNNQ